MWKNRLFRKGERAQKTERGQSFVELAISLIFLLTLLAAAIDLGWAFYTVIAMRDAAQEAAVYGSMCPNYPDKIIERLELSSSAPLDIADIEQVDVCVINSATFPPNGSCADADPAQDPELGYSIRVELRVIHEIRTPFVAAFIGTTTYPLDVDVSDLILRVEDDDCAD